MPSKYASGKFSIAECDRCGFRFKLKVLRHETVKTKLFQVKVCQECWSPDHPQLQLGMYPVNDPQAVRQPRPDVSYAVSGNTGLYTSIVSSNNTSSAGYPSDGSRQTQWGWYPVGGARAYDDSLTPNDLILLIQIGTVTTT